MAVNQLEKLRGKLNKMLDEGAPADKCLAVSQQLDILVAEEQRKIFEGVKSNESTSVTANRKA